MKDDRTTTLIWVLAALVAIGVLAVTLVVARQQRDGSGDFSEAQIEAIQRAYEEELRRQGFEESSFEDPIREFDSFEEAEEEAGYHILRPSRDFVLLGGVVYLETYLQPEGEDAPAASSSYVSQDGQQFTFQIFPSTYEAVDSRDYGVPTTIGDKDGWRVDYEARFFAWECGSTSSGTDLYCLVLAEYDVDEDAYEQFVASLR